MQKIYVIGIGMGNPDTITVKGSKIIKRCQGLIGAKRMVDSFAKDNQVIKYVIKPEEIIKFIEDNNKLDEIAVLMSGDVGFFSGAKKLRELIEKKWGTITGNDENIVQYIPGISSISYFCSKIGQVWQDVKIVSLHGLIDNPINYVADNEKVFFLTGGIGTSVKEICSDLDNADLGFVKVFVGENLSYEDERITIGTATSLKEQDFSSLSVMFVINDEFVKDNKITLGISDESFIRGQVPMTKEEVRTLTVSKLNIAKGDIIYDIGAGTGSVTIEMAKVDKYGTIYAIETNPEGIKLINENKKAFKVNNLKVVNGIAPEALVDLPKPNKAFIGGTKGNLKNILKSLIEKNNQIRVVINVVALESLSEAVECIKKLQFKDVEIIQVNISKAKKLGNYNLMMGQNPVFIISAQY